MPDNQVAISRDMIDCYIRNDLTNKNIEFELVPDEISESLSAAFEAQSIRGRSNPIQGYDNSGPISISFTVTLHDDYCREGILATVNAIKALEYPLYESYVKAPVCYVRIGDMIKARAVCNSVSISWQKPYRNGVFTKAEVSFDLVEVRSSPQDAREVESGVR